MSKFGMTPKRGLEGREHNLTRCPRGALRKNTDTFNNEKKPCLNTSKKCSKKWTWQIKSFKGINHMKFYFLAYITILNEIVGVVTKKT